eukprot:243212-Pelagomonas_calceolata.AAC.1
MVSREEAFLIRHLKPLLNINYLASLPSCQWVKINDAHLGYQMFANMLDNPDTSLFVEDAAGARRRIRFNYTRSVLCVDFK